LTKEKVVASLAAIIVITSCLWVSERDYIKKNSVYPTGLRLEFQTYDANYYDIAQALAEISAPNESVLIAEAGLRRARVSLILFHPALPETHLFINPVERQ
jgi:hypothetical protein